MDDLVAFISDVHGNLPALRAVLSDIDSQGIRERICLGDVAGYGAQPGECIDLLRSSRFKIIQGNHDAMAAGKQGLAGLAEPTIQSVLWTRSVLSAEHRQWLGELPLVFQGLDYEAVHASLHQPGDWNYILHAGAAARHFQHQHCDLCFIGHSHSPAMFVEGEASALSLTCLENVRHGRRQVINAGSVGQPRDHNPDACYLVYRRNHGDVWWRRIPYDVDAAQRAIMAAGLPSRHAERLSQGR